MVYRGTEKMSNVLRICICFAALLSVYSCQPDELNFNIRFDQIRGLKAGDSVFFEDNKVGQVENVVYTRDGDYLVKVIIQPNFSNTATRNSKFYIANSPQAEGKRAIEIVQEETGGAVLENGATVTGSVRPTIFKEIFEHFKNDSGQYQDRFDNDFEKFMANLRRGSEELEAGLEGALEDLSEQFSSLSEELRQVPDSRELKKLEETLNRLAEEMKQSQKVVREKIKNEVIPEIQKRLEILRDYLEQHNRQNEIDPLERQLNDIRET